MDKIEEYTRLHMENGYSEQTARTLAKTDIEKGYCMWQPDAFEARLTLKYTNYVVAEREKRLQNADN